MDRLANRRALLLESASCRGMPLTSRMSAVVAMGCIIVFMPVLLQHMCLNHACPHARTCHPRVS
eukprot:10460363-Alexandrium_andersonii.AAC.1